MPLGLPINVLMVVCPIGVALWLTYREQGTLGVRALLGRTLDGHHVPNKLWLLLSLAVMPAAMLLSYFVQRGIGQSLPEFTWSFSAVVFTFAVYFIGAVGEELGWMGYAIDPLQHRYGFLIASVGLGVVWWLWHVVPFYVLGRSTEWILWHGLATVAFRVVMVWIYNQAGRSVLTSILFHTMINTSQNFFPGGITHYDPMVTGLIVIGMALMSVGWQAIASRATRRRSGA
jgi:hypothetical protein